ncbi:MAG: hypothetical protein Q4D44_04080 [Eubacteriales bacterium]|nr:hypothetical protein [Eubacteriales bacterium]
MNDMVKKAFGIITGKVETALKEQGFKREKVSDTDKEMVALFTSENVAYTVVYTFENKHTVLRSCSMTEDGPDNQWKTMATWMFDPDTDTNKEAESIGNDFADSVTAASAIKRVKQAKKKKNGSSDEGNADPVFLAKRFVNYFPELRELIAEEQNNYESFRAVKFFRTEVNPRINDMLMRNQKAEIKKLAQMISTQYANGDMDTRSIITIVILNSIDEKYCESFNELLSEELQKAWKYALKMKGKKVRPEKKKKSLMAMAGDKLG